MKTPFELGSGLKSFVDIAVSTLDSNLSAITGAGVKLAIKESVKASKSDLQESYTDGVMVIGKEEAAFHELGFMGHVGDLTAMVDMMVMGSGGPKQTLDDDSKDGVSEMGNQFFGGITVPVDTQLGKKLSFKATYVGMVDPASFSNDEYIAVFLTGSLKGNPLDLVIFFDDSLSGQFEEKGQSMDTSSFFGGMDMDTPKAPAAHLDLGSAGANLDMLMDVEIPVSVRMGTARLFLKDILGLGPGNIVELEQNADEAIELVVNGKLVARGEVVIVDGYFGFRIKEIISKAERIRKLKD